MIMARNEDGTYSQVGFVKDNVGIDTEYIYDKDGDIVFEKGFTRETSGTVPLTINGIGKDLKDWSITGNTVQNGTPTPENPVEVQAVGDRTGNLFDYSTIRTGYRIIWATGADYTDNTAMMSDYIKVKNTTYRCSDKAVIICYDGNKNYLGALNSSMVVEKEAGAFYGMFTINDNECKFIKLLAYQGFVIGNKTMLNEGSTPLPYEPYGYKIPVVTSADGTEPITTPIYLPTPLYSGEVIKSDGSREVKWGKIVLTGEEKIAFAGTAGTSYRYDFTNIKTISQIKYARKNSKITHFEQCNMPTIDVVGYDWHGGSFHLMIMTTQSTINKFKDWLKSQYAAGTPITIWYQLAESTTETFTAPQIPTLNGTTVIDVDTTVKPTEMYTKYKSSK